MGDIADYYTDWGDVWESENEHLFHTGVDGKIPIARMSDSHLLNTIKLCIKRKLDYTYYSMEAKSRGLDSNTPD